MLLCVNNCMQTDKVYRDLADVEQKMYSYLALLKNVAFHAKNFLRTTTKGPPPRCLPQGPHHPRSTPGCILRACLVVGTYSGDCIYCTF